uniref:Uncharacterized protein n=1 Tax=Oryza meridionalis TaxID=40149 RepID=A0A0E0F371_9ORYZ
MLRQQAAGELGNLCSSLRLAPAPREAACGISGATGSYDPKAFCSKTTDVASCPRVYPTLPDDVAKSQDNEQLYTRLYDYCGVKIYEASSLAESMIATTTTADPVIIATFFPQWKGDEAITTKTPPGKCLLSYNKTIGDVDDIQTCGNTYMEDRPPMIHQNLTVLFHGGHPLPLCLRLPPVLNIRRRHHLPLQRPRRHEQLDIYVQHLIHSL